jgi:hypothetical protein
MRRYVAKGGRLPGCKRISLHHAAAVLCNGFQSRRKGKARNPAPPILLVHNETGNPPKPFLDLFESYSTIGAITVDPRQFLSVTELTPTHRLSIRVNQNPVGATLLEQFMFLAVISPASFAP